MQILADNREDADTIKLKAHVALEILSRAGYSPVRQVQIQQASVTAAFTAEEREALKKDAIRGGARFEGAGPEGDSVP